MALNSINTNIAALNAQSNIGQANALSATSIGRLSSGERIVNASDDVAGLAAGTSLTTTVTTLRAALTNASQGSSLLQVADGALAEVTDILQRQNSLAVQAGSGSLTDTERGFLNQEFQALSAEIDRLAAATTFNGVNLLNGTGASLSLASTDAIAAAFDPTAADANTGTNAESQVAIEAFDIAGNASALGNGVGQLQFVDGAATPAVLADDQFLTVNSNIVGGIESFRITDVQTGIAAVAEVVINGITLTGAFADGDTDVVVSNGTTRIQLGTGAIALTNETTVALAESTVQDAFDNVEILRTSTVAGVDFANTRLEGVTGAANVGVAQIRLNDSAASVQINNFQFLGTSGTDESTLSVQVNGETFIANSVNDVIAAGEILAFEDGNGQSLVINLTGLNDPTTATDNIRLSETTRAAFLDALNTGFGRAGAGLDFTVGETTADSINVNIGSVTTGALFGGQTIDVASAGSAQTAIGVVTAALDAVTAVRADVGATQSRFNFASANIEVSIQNQDAARAVFLDTDVAAESTTFATAQVQLQAGISVLAQANLLSQNLLKLIG